MRDLRVLITKEVKPEEVFQLYKASGWIAEHEKYDAEIITGMVQNSFCFAAAFDCNKLIGIGRCLSDGVSDAYIQDVFTLDAYRGLGVGQAIVREILKYLANFTIDWIGLVAVPEAAGFYEKFGFEILNGYTPMLYNPRKKFKE